VTAGDARRVQLQPAYVLHHRPYRDTSRILELFTRDHGRVSVFARGARASRRGTSFVPLLQPFNRLLVSWNGRGEAGQLTGAEFDGTVLNLPAQQLVNGYYLNELLLKLFARHDPHADVFALYDATIARLKTAEDPLPPLRVFEKRLLDAIGYGLALEHDATGQRIDPEASYHYRLEQGPVRVDSVAESPSVYSGSSLLALAREELSEGTSSADARRLLRAALDRCLEGRELRTRQVMLALRRGRGSEPSK
jgi:DNA repair protein RecO (recombination protein O)